jgi:hypothetical protein
LTRAQATEVLRYWLASLQLEEALAARPRARRAPAASSEARVAAPVAGQDYFKLAIDDALAALVGASVPLQKPFDGELAAFFEHWLAQRYRRGDDDRELSHLLAFPVVHLPRGELAGLLRFGVRVQFGDPGGPQFVAPSRSQRARKQFPNPPHEVRVSALGQSAKQWPFFVDTRLLQHQLGVARESIDAFVAALRAEPELDEATMLRAVCALLESELDAAAPETASQLTAAESVPRIVAAMVALLARNGGRARVYPVGVVVDSTRAKTTWYLQRELQQLLEERAELHWELDGCLGSYLTGRPAATGVALQRGLVRGPSLTASQRHAAEHAWGSTLAAVQGPPGTGKTTLILHMAAEAVIRQVDALADDGEMGRGPFVVTSTNNRAVDNVIDPLNADLGYRLPLALRAGSQRVCEHLLQPQLMAARTWLDVARGRPDREAALTQALQLFRGARNELRAALAPYASACDAATRAAQLRHELALLDEALAGAPPALDPDRVASLYEPLAKARTRIARLCELCEAQVGVAQLQAIDRQYRASAKRDLPALAEAASDAGIALELGLPPALPPTTDVGELMEAWEEAAQNAALQVETLHLQLAHALGTARARDRRQKLQRELAALGVQDELPERPACDALERALFEAAVAAREAWAAANAADLLRAVDAALAAVRGDASLRPLFNEDGETFQELQQLFGVWGCTLLSLGNCFPAKHGAIAHAVIDEAGQCHPTYAVSALVRSRAALIIGDVHQLEAVIDLEPADDERAIESCKLSLSAAQLAPYRVHSEARCSVQALADRAARERPRLTDHFRCQPEIIAICDALCGYGLTVHTPRQGPSAPLPFLPAPVSLIDVAGEQERLGGSWHNPAELELTLELLNALLGAGIAADDVAIITPYRGQLELLLRQLVRAGVPIDRSLELADLEQTPAAHSGGVAVGTVHRFQGGERSVVLFSSVVSRRASLSFLDRSEHLLNVAVSRARHRFVTIGSRAVLASGERSALLVRAATRVEPDSFRAQLRLV